ncbi:lipase catalyse the reaction, partial [Ilyonectria destructans]
DTDAIVSAFESAGESATELKRLYNIDPDRPSASKTGALDFINDCKFVLPIEKMIQTWRTAKKPVVRCVLDEVNPWQPSSGSHHPVDLLLLFGGLDLSFSAAAHQTGIEMRKKRMTQVEYLAKMDLDVTDRVFLALAAGGISLLN